ncbi:purine-cytosine permease family protein [Paenarthrobacter sp. NPDC090522]|uniref:purine-cytosine permease family protein n=1 Tax=Paenarthrobacter sp. NPDC090522 TaxID=3364383 RepID=UPI003817B5B8
MKSATRDSQSSHANAARSNAPIFERRSIEYIPRRERHGKPWHVTPVWFTSSANLASLAIGTIGVLSGLNLFYSLLAIVVGSAFGTFFAAFHSSQGPQLGMPQMIQSRPQYGYRGAALIYVIAAAAYIGFSVFGVVLMGQTLELLFSIPQNVGMVATTALSVIVAAVGYNIVHKLARWIALAFLLCYLVITFAMPPVLTFPEGAFSTDGFSMTFFLAQGAAAAAACLAWAPYVSDYTRYLPHMSVKASFFSTYLGLAVSSIWVMGVAAVVTAAFPGTGIIEAFFFGGNAVFGGFGSIVLVLGLIGTIYLGSMNFYGGSLTVISILDSIRSVRPTATMRIALTAAFGIVSLGIALAATDTLLAGYGTFLTILLYALAPWTATNLVDFFLVRKGSYSIREIFNPRGIYGGWNWRGFAAYVASLLAMLPFVMTGAWNGPVAEILGYDVAPYVGMAVAALVYYGLCRSMDLVGEREWISVADAGLEGDDEVDQP